MSINGYVGVIDVGCRTISGWCVGVTHGIVALRDGEIVGTGRMHDAASDVVNNVPDARGFTVTCTVPVSFLELAAGRLSVVALSGNGQVAMKMSTARHRVVVEEAIAEMGASLVTRTPLHVMADSSPYDPEFLVPETLVSTFADNLKRQRPAAPLAHFYHVYADDSGNWRDIWAEHWCNLVASGLYQQLDFRAVVIVGSGHEAQLAQETVTQQFRPQVCHVRESGFEQQTLSLLQDWIAGTPLHYVLYAHTKGATRIEPAHQDRWRRSMLHFVVDRWREAVDTLADHDAVGCHWTELSDHPDRVMTAPFFAGNFWWARSDFLQRLPEVDWGDRYRAEDWIGSGPRPSVVDMNPGWPSMAIYHDEVVRPMEVRLDA